MFIHPILEFLLSASAGAALLGYVIHRARQDSADRSALVEARRSKA